MKKSLLFLLVCGLKCASLSAQTLEHDAAPNDIKALGKRYFLSTNLISIAALVPNIGLEVRFPGTFALKTSVFYGGPWPLNIPYGTDRRRVLGLHMEPRWYFNERKRFYAGCALNPILFSSYDREYNYETMQYEGPRKYEESTIMITTNVLIGNRVPVSSRFEIDFNLGVGIIVFPTSSGNMPPVFPGGQASVSLSWELGR